VSAGGVDVANPAVMVAGEVVQVRRELEALAARAAVPAGA
jgi:hypothetical protein